MNRYRGAALAAGLAVAAACPAAAQTSLVSAQQPQTLVEALDVAG